jgi:hypothetical protein
LIQGKTKLSFRLFVFPRQKYMRARSTNIVFNEEDINILFATKHMTFNLQYTWHLYSLIDMQAL